jgi:hypothetical protein
MISSIRIAALTVLLCAASLSGAKADDAFYAGQWKIIGAVVAPWVASGETPDAAEMKSLMGQIITLKADAVEGPGSFPCKGPKYEVMQGGPEMLFQGMFGQMHDENAANDPQKLAEQVGFTGAQYRTVITGCEYEVDFSFGADEDAAKFALNNYVYTMKRE